MNPIEMYNGYYQLGSIARNNLQQWSNLSPEMEELSINPIGKCLTREHAEDVIARANLRRGDEPGSSTFRTLGKPINTSTQTTSNVVSKENMKLNISRTKLIAGLENYIETETETFTANTQAFNDSQASIVSFVASQKAQVAKKNLVAEENVTPDMLAKAVKSISEQLGMTSNPPTSPNFSVVNTLLNKLNLSTDETIELTADDPILSYFNATK